MNWLRENWLRLHLAVAPIGTLTITWLLRVAAGDGLQWWRSVESLEGMGQVVPLSAAIYGSAIAIIEGAVRMFWALAQIAKDIDQWRSEGREQGLKEGLELGMERGREEGRQEIIRLLAERNIELPPEFLNNGNGQADEPRQS